MRIFFITFFLVIIAIISLAGFRGAKTEKTPLYVFPDMDRQQKFHPQGENEFFSNKMDDRLPVSGTVMRGNELNTAEVFAADYQNAYIENPEWVTGQDADGAEIPTIPFEVTSEFMAVGREKYDIYCTVCHGAAGRGNGVTLNYGIAASNLVTDLYLERPDGNIYRTITYGYNTMMGYGDKLDVRERWAVVAYVRALQKAYNASEEDLTPQQIQELGL
jgi:mono/diheme cytochrome c family protein